MNQKENQTGVSQEELIRNNKLGIMPVNKLLINVSLPIVLSMLVQALYNVVDTIFVSRLPDKEAAFAAMGFAFSIQNLMIAVAVGTSVGIASRLGRRLGEQNADSVNRTATNGMFLMVLSWLAFAIFGIFGVNAYMHSFENGSVDPLAIQMGIDYLSIVCIGSLGLFISIAIERFLQSTGRSMFSMAAQMSGAVTNIILDPLLIFGIGPFPALGVAGAAYATVIGQWVGMFVGVISNHYKNPEIKMSFRGFRPNPKTIKHIYQVGLPSIIMQSIGSVMTFGMNMILNTFSTAAVAVFSIYFKLQSFIFMPVIGFNNGMVPIVSFNYGAKKPSRIGESVKLTACINVGIMLVGTILFWAVPTQLLALFDATPEMYASGVGMLRTISLCFVPAAVSIVFSGSFQALGKGLYSLSMSILRQLFFLLPLAWFFARTGGLDMIWYAFPVAELSSLILAVYFFRRMWRNLIAPLAAEEVGEKKGKAIT